MPKTDCRTFKVRLENENCNNYRGRFTGNPQQAAKKALTSLLNEKNKKTGKFNFVIKETTRGSKKKEYGYIGKKTKRKQPNKAYFPGSDTYVLYKYDTSVTSNKNFASTLNNKMN
jgi:hypothetical protein